MPTSPDVASKLNFLMTTTWNATAYLGPMLLKQGQSPKSIAKIATDYAISCYQYIAEECGMIEHKAGSLPKRNIAP